MEIVTYIDNSVSIPENSSVGAFSTIKANCHIGERTSIGSMYACLKMSK